MIALYKIPLGKIYRPILVELSKVIFTANSPLSNYVKVFNSVATGGIGISTPKYTFNFDRTTEQFITLKNFKPSKSLSRNPGGDYRRRCTFSTDAGVELHKAVILIRQYLESEHHQNAMKIRNELIIPFTLFNTGTLDFISKLKK